MKALYDYRGMAVRLTEERLAHILEHPEMWEMESALERALAEPESVIRSLSDPNARLCYRTYADTPVGGKLLCVVVKVVAGRLRTDRLPHRQAQTRRGYMERGAVKLYYDPEGDYMEVLFDKKAGYFRETEDDRIMEKVDTNGNVLGFSALNISSLKGKPFEVALG